MPKIRDISVYKRNKKIKQILKEVEALISLYDLFLTTLKKYGKYPSVNEVMSVIAQNRTTLTIQHKKYTKVIEESEHGELEKTE